MSASSIAAHPPALSPIECCADGSWSVRGYSEAREIMLADTTQAGFSSELVRKMPANMILPMLFQDGEAHRKQRTQVAKLFTPAMTNHQHYQVMQRCADQIVASFKQTGRADLSELASRMAVSVASEIVGLTNSNMARMTRRLNFIVHANLDFGFKPAQLLRYARIQWQLLQFWLFDVRPAIKARKQTPQTDLISHLISKGRGGVEILTECLTFGAAGMVTTQEFICAAFWQCMQQPELREIMQGDDQEQRYQVLHEILRVQPAIQVLQRRAASDLNIQSGGETVTIPAGALINFDIEAINRDQRVVADQPAAACPGRSFDAKTSRSVMGFGSGPHRCPGEFVALLETDVFLRHLLALDGVYIEREPTRGHNTTVHGYEFRNFIIGLRGQAAS